MEPTDILEVLVELNHLDRDALYKLLLHKVETNNAVANHKTIQVRQCANGSRFTVSVLGIINGFLGKQDKFIVAEIDFQNKEIISLSLCDQEECGVKNNGKD